MIVAADGSGDVRTIQEAVDAVPEANSKPFVIRIRPGTYREKVRVEKSFVHLIGDEVTRIVWDDHATKTFADGRKYGTFESYTLLVTGDDFRAEGLTIENAAGPGTLVGQAVAAYVDADRAAFRQCRFLGHQDTLFTGPLPPKPLTVSAFGGPRDGLERRPTRQYYGECFFRGDVDFLFGSATVMFDRCEVFSNERNDPHDPINGWITAASTPEGVPHGYVFLDCLLTGDAAPGSVYLGRPWREFAKTAFVRCWMGAHIRNEGWHDWDKPGAHATTFYAEAGSTGPGAAGPRVGWSHRLSPSEVAGLTVAAVLGGDDGWNPARV